MKHCAYRSMCAYKVEYGSLISKNHIHAHLKPEHLKSDKNKHHHPRIYLPFWSRGQGPVEFGKISFKPSTFGILMQSKITGLPF